MKLEHTCRIVRGATTDPAFSLYWDGAYLDRFDSSRDARAAALALCPRRERETVEVLVEDASGSRISLERLLLEPDR